MARFITPLPAMTLRLCGSLITWRVNDPDTVSGKVPVNEYAFHSTIFPLNRKMLIHVPSEASRARDATLPWTLPAHELLIYLATMPNCHHHDEQDPVIDCVDDSVIADPEPIAISSTKLARRRRTRIVSKQSNRTVNAGLYRSI